MCLCISAPLLQMALRVLGLKLVVSGVWQRVCNSHFRWSMQSNPSTGWPSLASTHCYKLCISLASRFKSPWLLGRRLLRQPSASDPLKAIVVSELFMLSLSSVFLVSSMRALRSVFACLSHSSMVSGHSVGFICSAVCLVSVYNFPQHGLDWWTCPSVTFVMASCHVQSIYTEECGRITY